MFLQIMLLQKLWTTWKFRRGRPDFARSESSGCRCGNRSERDNETPPKSSSGRICSFDFLLQSKESLDILYPLTKNIHEKYNDAKQLGKGLQGV